MRWLAMLLVPLALAGCRRGKSETPPVGSESGEKPGSSGEDAQVEAKQLRPGRYRIELVADEGAKKGASSKGDLTLITARPDDSSPVTSEKPTSRVGERYPLYGYTNLDFKAVDAPMPAKYERGEIPPAPDSRDPIYPGVLVLELPPEGERVMGAKWILTIGTVSNMRTSRRVTDGAGIALRVKAHEGDSLSGVWTAWGLRHAGSGTWSAKRVSD